MHGAYLKLTSAIQRGRIEEVYLSEVRACAARIMQQRMFKELDIEGAQSQDVCCEDGDDSPLSLVGDNSPLSFVF